MRDIRRQTTAILLGLSWAIMACAQVPQSPATVPKLVRFSGSFHPSSGAPAQTAEGVTLSVYKDQSGGDALWQEIQNVVVDPEGHFSVLLGSTRNEGVPIDLFASGEPRWLSAQFNRPGEAEQARVLLVSVPYALKSADAETLGGKPASAYLLAAPAVGTATVSSATTATAVKPKATPQNNGMPNYIGKFINTTDLIDSAMYEINGNVGIFTTTPTISLDVRTGSLPQMGIAGTTDYLTFFASDQFGPAIYWDPAKDMRFGKGGSGLYNPYGFVEQVRIQSSTGNVGIGTPKPGSKLDVSGDINLSGSLLFQGTPVLQIPPGLDGGNIVLGGGLFGNTTGSGNTALGYLALLNNTTADWNTATGNSAMLNNTTGQFNTATGFDALFLNTTGNDNTAVGFNALPHNTIGNNNIAVGYAAASGIATGNSNNIDIGSQGSVNDSGVIRVGTPGTQASFFAAGIRSVTTGNNDAIPVVIDSAGQFGTASSSRRFKEDIADMGAASRDLMRLRPVTFRYRKPFADGSKPIQYGLIAEEVAEVYPDLVAHSANGQIETVKYQVLDSMLLNEVQRLAHELDEQRQQNQSLQERLARLEAVLASMPATQGSR